MDLDSDRYHYYSQYGICVFRQWRDVLLVLIKILLGFVVLLSETLTVY